MSITEVQVPIMSRVSPGVEIEEALDLLQRAEVARVGRRLREAEALLSQAVVRISRVQAMVGREDGRTGVRLGAFGLGEIAETAHISSRDRFVVARVQGVNVQGDAHDAAAHAGAFEQYVPVSVFDRRTGDMTLVHDA